MKIITTMIVLSMTILSQFIFTRARIPIPYGESDEIIKMVDLPDTDMFQLDDGTYFDIGSKYTISHIVWLAYSNTEPEIVGFIDGREDEYLELSAEQLKEIGTLAEVEIPAEGEVSFFHKIGGKIVLGLLGAVILYGIYSSYFGKEDEEEMQTTDATKTE